MSDPEQAVPLPGAIAVLALLARRYARVGVISGRPVAYLLARLGDVDGLMLSGLYGLESTLVGRGGVTVHPEARPYRAAVSDVAALAEAEAPTGVYVEHKGLSVGLHVRGAPEQAGWVDHFAAEQAARTGLRAHAGKLSVELRPPLDVDKGTVLGHLAEGLGAVAYFGDDLGDLPAFATLRVMRDGGTVTRAVAVSSPEAPAEVLAAADEVTDGPAGALGILRSLTED